MKIISHMYGQDSAVAARVKTKAEVVICRVQWGSLGGLSRLGPSRRVQALPVGGSRPDSRAVTAQMGWMDGWDEMR